MTPRRTTEREPGQENVRSKDINNDPERRTCQAGWSKGRKESSAREGKVTKLDREPAGLFSASSSCLYSWEPSITSPLKAEGTEARESRELGETGRHEHGPPAPWVPPIFKCLFSFRRKQRLIFHPATSYFYCTCSRFSVFWGLFHCLCSLHFICSSGNRTRTKGSLNSVLNESLTFQSLYL